MKTLFLSLLLSIFYLAQLKAQSPYKINPATGGYLLDGSGNPIRNDKNWDIVNFKFIDEFNSQSNTENLWNYLLERPYIDQSTNSLSPLYYYIDDKDNGLNANYVAYGINSPECTPPYSITNKKSHFFGTTPGISSCVLKFTKENIQGWYYRFDTTACVGNSVGFRKQLTRPNWFKYTSGYLQSKNLFRYGWFETRCRIKTPKPTSQEAFRGIGYNFWLYNSLETKYSEIDIFETDLRRDLMTSNIHLNTSSGLANGLGYFQNREDPNAPNGIDCTSKPFYMDTTVATHNFHTYSLEWLNNNITTFYDNQRVMHYRHRDNPAASPTLFNPMYIIYGFGAPYFCKTPIDNPSNGLHQLSGIAPSAIEYEIDYVKVYKLICTNTTDVIQTSNSNYNFNNYAYGVKNNIIFGGSNCVAKVTNGSNVSLRAKTSIELKGGFEVEAGGEFYANICDCTP
jgi:Glycosyl hydrolases family 16